MLASEIIQEDLKGRVCLVTGSNTGIGRVTALELARAGAQVILACRSEEKTQVVIDEIVQQTDNDKVEFLRLDLSSLASVRSAADEFLGAGRPLHLLINNAGLAGHRGITTDGFELQFGVNYLGHYLLSRLLLPVMQESAPARIVNVSSRGHLKAKGIDFEAVVRKTNSVAGFKEYCVSKLANVLFSMELANRQGGVTSYSLHPGVIQSEIWRRVPWPIRPLMTRGMQTVEEGAHTSLYCATAAELASESGLYYSDCQRSETNDAATPALARDLWERSEQWCAAYLS
jgi:retinol dehydrogenase-12